MCKTSALPVELLARVQQIRGKGSNLDLHVQSVVSCLVRRPRSNWGASAPPSIPRTGDRRSRHPSRVSRSCSMCRPPRAHTRDGRPVHATRLTLRPWITDRRCADPQRSPSYVEGRWSPSSAVLLGKMQAKADAYTGAISREQRCEVFLSQAGPRFGLVVLQAEHHLLFRVGSGRLQKRKRRPSWVALIWPVLLLGD